MMENQKCVLVDQDAAFRNILLSRSIVSPGKFKGLYFNFPHVFAINYASETLPEEVRALLAAAQPALPLHMVELQLSYKSLSAGN